MMITLNFSQATFNIKLILSVVQLLLLSSLVQTSGSGREDDSDAFQTISSGLFIFYLNELIDCTTYLLLPSVAGPDFSVVGKGRSLEADITLITRYFALMLTDLRPVN